MITDMKLVHTSVIFATAALLMAGCDLKQANDKENTEPTEEETLMAEEGFTFVELVPKPLPCSKEAIQAAWKQIGTVERPHTKTIDYRQNTPTLFISTDLDKDGTSEVWLPYALGCLSDPGQHPMKIIMYEGTQKYAMRGLSRSLGGPAGDGGTMDAALRSGPAVFRSYAQKLWQNIRLYY